MFTQINKINTNKCNGCKQHCELDAVFSEKKKTGFLPTINGRTIVYYIKDNIRRPLRLYNTRNDAINAAKTIIKTCKRYNPKTSTITTQKNTNTCTGCIKQCIFGASKQSDGYLPKIQNQTIHGYIDTHGTLKLTHIQKTEIHAIVYARHIAERCDFYKKQR